MGRVLSYILIGIFVVIGALVLLYYGFNYLMVTGLKPIDQIVAIDVSVSAEWTEIIPESPMKVTKQTQTVILIIDGFKHNVGERPWKIRLPDGTVVKPQIQVFDEFGNVYELHDSSRVGNDIGFSPEIDSSRFTDFPENRTYTKIRISSDKPFQCSKIIWRNKKLK